MNEITVLAYVAGRGQERGILPRNESECEREGEYKGESGTNVKMKDVALSLASSLSVAVREHSQWV